MTNEFENKIQLLEKERELADLFSKQYFEIQKMLAYLYYQNKQYNKALNSLQHLENHKENLEWTNLCFLACIIQTPAVEGYFKSPHLHFFKRLNQLDESNKEVINQRNSVFKESLNVFLLNYPFKLKDIDLDAFYEEACLLDVLDSFEWRNFIVNIAPEKQKKYLPKLKDTVLNKINIRDFFFDEKEEKIKKLEKENAHLKKELEIRKSSIATAEENKEDYPLNNAKILILGAITGNLNKYIGKAEKQFNLSKENFEFCIDYEKIKKETGKIKQYSSKYDAIIVGAMPHKTEGNQGYSSSIEKWEKEEGYPYMVKAKNKNGDLKFSISSFLDALNQVCTHLNSFPKYKR